MSNRWTITGGGLTTASSGTGTTASGTGTSFNIRYTVTGFHTYNGVDYGTNSNFSNSPVQSGRAPTLADFTVAYNNSNTFNASIVPTLTSTDTANLGTVRFYWNVSNPTSPTGGPNNVGPTTLSAPLNTGVAGTINYDNCTWDRVFSFLIYASNEYGQSTPSNIIARSGPQEARPAPFSSARTASISQATGIVTASMTIGNVVGTTNWTMRVLPYSGDFASGSVTVNNTTVTRDSGSAPRFFDYFNKTVAFTVENSASGCIRATPGSEQYASIDDYSIVTPIFGAATTTAASDNITITVTLTNVPTPPATVSLVTLWTAPGGTITSEANNTCSVNVGTQGIVYRIYARYRMRDAAGVTNEKFSSTAEQEVNSGDFLVAPTVAITYAAATVTTATGIATVNANYSITNGTISSATVDGNTLSPVPSGGSLSYTTDTGSINNYGKVFPIVVNAINGAGLTGFANSNATAQQIPISIGAISFSDYNRNNFLITASIANPPGFPSGLTKEWRITTGTAASNTGIGDVSVRGSSFSALYTIEANYDLGGTNYGIATTTGTSGPQPDPTTVSINAGPTATVDATNGRVRIQATCTTERESTAATWTVDGATRATGTNSLDVTIDPPGNKLDHFNRSFSIIATVGNNAGGTTSSTAVDTNITAAFNPTITVTGFTFGYSSGLTFTISANIADPPAFATGMTKSWSITPTTGTDPSVGTGNVSSTGNQFTTSYTITPRYLYSSVTYGTGSASSNSPTINLTGIYNGSNTNITTFTITNTFIASQTLRSGVSITSASVTAFGGGGSFSITGSVTATSVRFSRAGGNPGSWLNYAINYTYTS